MKARSDGRFLVWDLFWGVCDNVLNCSKPPQERAFYPSAREYPSFWNIFLTLQHNINEIWFYRIVYDSLFSVVHIFTLLTTSNRSKIRQNYLKLNWNALAIFSTFPDCFFKKLVMYLFGVAIQLIGYILVGVLLSLWSTHFFLLLENCTFMSFLLLFQCWKKFLHQVCTSALHLQTFLLHSNLFTWNLFRTFSFISR